MLVLLLISLVIIGVRGASAAAASESSPKELVWICMFYHKTGTEFCRKMFKRLSNMCNLTHGSDADSDEAKSNALLYYHNDSTNNKLLTTSHFISMRPAAFGDPWLKVFESPSRIYRAILMVRDPFILIMSSYKYHSQPVPPEHWLHSKSLGFCTNHTDLSSWESIVRAQGSVKEIIKIYSGIDRLCDELSAIFTKRSSYHHKLIAIGRLNASTVNSFPKPAAAQAFLQSMPKYTHDSEKFGPDLYPAVRMEAFRTLREVENMAITKLHEEPSMSMSMCLEDFGVGNKTKFREAARRMVDFVLRDAPKTASVAKCLDPDEFVTHIVRASYLDPSVITKPPPQGKRRTNSTHITQGLMSKETQLEYIRRLRIDPILGDYLTMLAEIINTPTPTDGKPLIEKFPRLALPPPPAARNAKEEGIEP
eukprot:gene31384-37934_t